MPMQEIVQEEKARYEQAIFKSIFSKYEVKLTPIKQETNKVTNYDWMLKCDYHLIGNPADQACYQYIYNFQNRRYRQAQVFLNALMPGVYFAYREFKRRYNYY